jgi:hypothetical protein
MFGAGAIRLGLAALLAATGLPGVAAATDTGGPWRLEQAAEAPGWLKFGGTYRLRYETLNHPYRARATGSDEILVGQLLLNARITFDTFYANFELQDARQELADSGTALGTDSVNTFEPLQAYVGMRFDDAFASGDRLDVIAGRMTINLGSRRLVARNAFRNTINSFTGVNATWKQRDGVETRAFYVRPLQRKPADLAALLNNDTELDTESSDVSLWGVFTMAPNFFGKSNAEAYFYSFRSRDHIGIPLADRDLYTPGFRLFKNAAVSSWDFETEASLQFGTSRASTAASDTRDLQHRAGFFHGEVGYTWPAKMSPRLEASYDYASGDRDPNDNENNRYDTLYGARRFDYGPTGIYGPIARSNISSPGVRLEARPVQKMMGMFGYRAVWLASDRDQHTAGRLQDPSGDAGSFVGHQLEAQLVYQLRPGNLMLELGGARLFHGRFLEDAPNAPAEGDTTYIYAQALATF